MGWRQRIVLSIGPGDGWVSLCIYRFRDGAAIDASLSSRETERVMADVPNFTDAEVTRSLFTPLLTSMEIPCASP